MPKSKTSPRVSDILHRDIPGETELLARSQKLYSSKTLAQVTTSSQGPWPALPPV